MILATIMQTLSRLLPFLKLQMELIDKPDFIPVLKVAKITSMTITRTSISSIQDQIVPI